MITRRRFDKARFGADPSRTQRHLATVGSIAMFFVILLGAAASSEADQTVPVPEQVNRPAAARVVLVGTTTTSPPPSAEVAGDADEGATAPDDRPSGNSSDDPADR